MKKLSSSANYIGLSIIRKFKLRSFLSWILTNSPPFTLTFLTVTALLVLVILRKSNRDSVRYCFLDDQHMVVSALQRLEDVLLSERKPTPGRTIFFHETSCHRPLGATKLIRLNARQACAVESAALHNPNFDIFVLFASAAYKDKITSQPFLDVVLSFSNVHLRKVNLWSYAANTSISNWLSSGEIFKSNYIFAHISDFLRFLTLWRWGGTHLDLDLIVRKSIEDLPPNYMGAQSKSINSICSAVMNFAPDGIGHKVAGEILIDFERTFNAIVWSNNGPGVITRAMERICQTTDTTMMTRERCYGFKVFPEETFYAVSWPMWNRFFETQYTDEILNQTLNSYVVHIWNKYSIQRPVKKGSNVAYGKLAEQNCPNVYAACKGFF